MSVSVAAHAAAAAQPPSNEASLDTRRGASRFAAVTDDNCPHAELFSFVLIAWASKSGRPARARSYAEGHDGQLTLSLHPDNRWCDHVQRQHKSNGTYLRISRRRRTFAQFCFDPDCRAAGFHGSSELPIAPELCCFEVDAPQIPSPSHERLLQEQFAESDAAATLLLVTSQVTHTLPGGDEWAQQRHDTPAPQQQPGGGDEWAQQRHDTPAPQQQPGGGDEWAQQRHDAPAPQQRHDAPAPQQQSRLVWVEHLGCWQPEQPEDSPLPPMPTPQPQKLISTYFASATGNQDCEAAPANATAKSAPQTGSHSAKQPLPPPPLPQPPPRPPLLSSRWPKPPPPLPQPSVKMACAAVSKLALHVPHPLPQEQNENRAMHEANRQGNERHQSGGTVVCDDHVQPSWPQSIHCRAISRLKHEQRRPANGLGRTPMRDEASPCRGREHPLESPSPVCHEGIAVQRRALAALSPHRIPMLARSLLSSPLSCFPRLGTTSGSPDPMHSSPANLHGCSSPDSRQSSPDNSQGASPSPQMHISPDRLPPSHGPLKASGCELQAAFDSSGTQDNRWACAACTLINAHDATRCVVCDALRGCTIASATTLAAQQMGPHAPKSEVTATTNARDPKRAGSRAGQAQPSLIRGQTSILGFMRARRQE